MATKNVESLVLVGNGNGIVIIPSNSPLKRLNYFDGKFLRASDLKDEQSYVRQLVRLSNQAGGSGAVHGFDLTLGGGDTLNLGPGLGIDPQGRVLLLPQEVSMGIQELIDLSLKAQLAKKKSKEESGVFGDCVMISDTPPINQAFPGELYLIVLFPAEALCGEEDVYGKLCEEACATSTDRPFAVEGLIVRAVPLVLQTPLLQSKIVTITSKPYLRSRVASAYFEDERLRVASMISKFGLAQEVWCLGAEAAGGNGLPIGVIARAGETTIFLDAWIARRERMDTPPRRYWQWRMMMRPWDVYMAQILQFQCQLRDLFDGDFTPEAEDPCGDAKTVLGEAAKKLADFLQAHKELSTDSAFQADLLQLETMSQKLTLTEQGMKVVPIGNRWLIKGGILTTPSAAYLPVQPNGNISVNEQVTKMMGEGVDLRFCIVRPDFVAHALEEAQHMERISLIEGLDDPKLKPEVDVLVPDGEFMTSQPATQPGFAVDAKLQAKHSFAGNSGTTTVPDVPFKGVARNETLASGGTAFYLASSSVATGSVLTVGFDLVKWKQLLTLQNPNITPSLGLWSSFKADKNIFLLKPGDKTNVSAEIVVGLADRLDFRGEISGELTRTGTNEEFPIAGTIDGNFSFSGIAFPAKSGTGKFFFLGKQEGSTVQILFGQEDNNNVQFGIEVDFTNPANVVAKLASKTLPDKSSMFEINFNSNLVLNNDVFSATNTDHVLAVQALGFIAGALKDPNFAAEKSKLLFPEVGTGQSTGIRATRDWVLFHRRRNKNCGAAVAASTRSYRVYQRAAVGITNPDDLFPKQPPTKEELLALTAKDLEGIKPTGVVTFGGGVATLVGDSSAVQNAWLKIPGGKIVWAGIGSGGDAVNDGETLARNRVQSLESVLDQVDPSARVDVLPIVPPLLASNDVDGIIILVNAAAPAPAPSANLRITKTAVLGAPDAAGAGPLLTFNLEVVNDGPLPAQDVKVTDPTPANTFLSSTTAPPGWGKTGPASGGTGTVTFQKASVAPGEKANFQIAVRVSPNFPSGTINNTATVASATSDPNQQNNTATTATTITAGAPPPPPPPPKLSCLTVFSVSDFGELDQVRNEFNRGVNPLSRLLPSLGDINFQERTTNVPDSSLVTTRSNYVKRNVGSVSGALLIMRKDVQAADSDAFRKQVAAIRAQFPIAQGTQPPLQELQLTTLPAEIKCQAGVILAGEVVG